MCSFVTDVVKNVLTFYLWCNILRCYFHLIDVTSGLYLPHCLICMSLRLEAIVCFGSGLEHVGPVLDISKRFKLQEVHVNPLTVKNDQVTRVTFLLEFLQAKVIADVLNSGK